LDESLNIALRSAIDLLEADAGVVHLVEGEPPVLRVRAHAGLGAEVLEEIAGVSIEGSGADPVADAVGRHTALHPMARAPLMLKGQHYGELRLFGADRGRVTRREELLLGTVAEQTAAAIAGVRLEESERERRQMHRHLALAADIQRRMLPTGIPATRGVDAAARYVSSLELGGDFYDFIALSGHLGIVVGDVVGKGVPAALLMSAVRATLRAHATDVYDINQVISRVNVALSRDTRDNEFATVFFGVIDPATLRLTYCNAGHDLPVVVRQSASGGDFEVFRLDIGGMAVGIDETQEYQRAIFHLHRGDLLLAYTDGVTDARNFADEKYGVPRLMDCVTTMLSDQPGATADHIVNHILWDVRRFTGLRPAVDDITLVAVRMV
jgi:sigma-B regulation protein RsbU (phosphoserine phosphatase)